MKVNDDPCTDLVIALERIKQIVELPETILPDYRLKALESAYSVAYNAIVLYNEKRKL